MAARPPGPIPSPPPAPHPPRACPRPAKQKERPPPAIPRPRPTWPLPPPRGDAPAGAAQPSPPASAPAACRRTLALPGIRAPGRTADPLPGGAPAAPAPPPAAILAATRTGCASLGPFRPFPSLLSLRAPPRPLTARPGPARRRLSSARKRRRRRRLGWAGLGGLGGPAQLGCCSPAFFRRLRPPPRPDPPPSGDWGAPFPAASKQTASLARSKSRRIPAGCQWPRARPACQASSGTGWQRGRRCPARGFFCRARKGGEQKGGLRFCEGQIAPPARPDAGYGAPLPAL